MRGTEYQAWLAALKPGDTVAALGGYNPEYGYDYAMMKNIYWHQLRTSLLQEIV